MFKAQVQLFAKGSGVRSTSRALQQIPENMPSPEVPAHSKTRTEGRLRSGSGSWFCALRSAFLPPITLAHPSLSLFVSLTSLQTSREQGSVSVSIVSDVLSKGLCKHRIKHTVAHNKYVGINAWADDKCVGENRNLRAEQLRSSFHGDVYTGPD